MSKYCLKGDSKSSRIAYFGDGGGDGSFSVGADHSGGSEFLNTLKRPKRFTLGQMENCNPNILFVIGSNGWERRSAKRLGVGQVGQPQPSPN